MINKKELLPCKCGEMNQGFYRLLHYRPKEFIVKCESCGLGVVGRGCHLHVLERAWNKAVVDNLLVRVGD